MKVNSPNYWQIRIVKARKKPQRGKYIEVEIEYLANL
jgi:hypothetical protein